MGGHYSTFSDNEELIDNIKESVQLPAELERIVRLVDRGLYSVEPKTRIYSDAAWKSGTLHLSAPSIYCTVLREIDIHRGHSVLNVGSGTGYLSTMFGLLIGSNGVNHGIEVCKSNIAFAKTCLAKFLSNSDSVYERDFCAPHFMLGNIFILVPPLSTTAVSSGEHPSSTTQQVNSEEENEDEGEGDDGTDEYFPSVNLNSDEFSIELPPLINNNYSDGEDAFWPLYDRIYVGSEVRTKEQLEAILRLLKIGGLLIAPVNDQFVKIERTSASKVHTKSLLNVSFAPLISPTPSDSFLIGPPPRRCVERLERLAARNLRYHLRRIVNARYQGPPVLGRFVVDKKNEKDEKQASDKCSAKRNEEDDATTLQASSSSSPSSHSDSLARQERDQSSLSKREASSSEQDARESSPLKRPCLDEGNNATQAPTRSTPSSASVIVMNRNHRDEHFYFDLLASVLNPPRNMRILNEMEEGENVEDRNPGAIVGPDLEGDVEVPEEIQDDDTASEEEEKKKKTHKIWVPQSYTYRETMLRILLEELNVPEFLANRAMAVI